MDENWNELKNKLLELRNQYVPKSKDRSFSWNTKGNFPISFELRQMIKDKSRYHRKWIKSQNKPHEKKQRDEYKKIRNKVKKAILEAKKVNERRICNQSKTNPKNE